MQWRVLSIIVEMLFLTAFHRAIMYAKIWAKNWATLYEIAPSKGLKIKSVPQDGSFSVLPVLEMPKNP